MTTIRIFILFMMLSAFSDLRAQLYDLTDTTQLYQSILNDTTFISKVKKEFKNPLITQMCFAFNYDNKNDSALGLTFLDQVIQPNRLGSLDTCAYIKIRLRKVQSNLYKLDLLLSKTGKPYKGCAFFHTKGITWTLKRKKGGYMIKKREYNGAVGSYKYL